MKGLGSLFSLIVLAALPLALAYLWLLIRKYRFNMLWFLCSLLGGILSVLITMLVQALLPDMYAGTIWELLKKIVLRTAVPEEGSRLIAMFLLIFLSGRWKRLGGPLDRIPAGAATGLICGMGFALFETVAYSISDIQVTLIRALTSSPLHAACGIRIGMGAVSLKNREAGSGLWNILLAVFIHAAYNFVIINPRVPLFMPLIIVLASTIASLVYIKAV